MFPSHDPREDSVKSFESKENKVGVGGGGGGAKRARDETRSSKADFSAQL